MSSVYVVVAIAHNKLEVLETYAGYQSAYWRARNLALSQHDASIDTVHYFPEENKISDGSIRWIVVQNAHAFVGIFFKPIQIGTKSEQELKTLDDLTSAWIPPILPPRDFVVTQPQHKDNKHDPLLPAGWSCQNKPILMQDLTSEPSDVMAHNFLNDAQQWAITKARIAKRPHYTIVLSDGVYVQSTALQCLGKNHNDANSFGWEIVADEMEFLASLTYGLINH